MKRLSRVGIAKSTKRAKTVEVQYLLPSCGPVAHVVIDTTGLKVFGECEWKMREHGKEKRRVWRKQHLAIDANTHEVISAVVSLESVGHNEALPTLLNPLRRKITQVSAYDTKACHHVLRKKGIKPTTPPLSNAGFWEDGHLRNEAVIALKSGYLEEWKREEGYHQRSLSGTGMYRYKKLLGPQLALPDYDAQVGEALASVGAMNKVIRPGMPASYRVE